MTRSRCLLPTLALVLPGLAGVALASIERLTLRQMVEKVDGAVLGEIVSRSVTPVPVDDGAEELYFTTLTVQGRSLFDGSDLTVSVSFPGGFVDAERGVWNAEAPSEDDVKLGNTIVAFYKWSDDMGGGFAANALYASHGGLFRTFQSSKGVRIAQGRGDGYAIPENRTVEELEKDVRAHKSELQKKR